MEQVVVYIDDILTVDTGTYDEHMEVVAEVLSRLEMKGIQVN